jgi:GWxTD domain-containing protein
MHRMTKAAASIAMATCLLLLLACGSTSSPKTPDALELFNHRLGPAYGQWMVGAASRMASPEEIKSFLDLQNDEQAEAFIEEFWVKRSGRMPGTLQTFRSAFESRSDEADRLFSESGRAGRSSDRGTIHVLYGKPQDSSFADASLDDSRTVELWTYAKDAPAGLDGSTPETTYRFIDQGDLTVFYRGTAGLRPRPPRL